MNNDYEALITHVRGILDSDQTDETKIVWITGLIKGWTDG